MKPYRYSHLPGGSIRLLHLLPANENSLIECRLSTHPLLKTSRPHIYEALSYVWGSESNPKLITLDGQDVEIGVNLHDALAHLRDEFVERVLWVDALCINQQDNMEKGKQVQAMALIYAKACRVIVWLGKAGDGDEPVLEEIRRVAAERSVKPKFTIKASPAVARLLRRPWFERIWVLQEVAAARHVIVNLGHDEIDGQTFCLGMEAIDIKPSFTPRDERKYMFLVRSVCRLISGAALRVRHSLKADEEGRFTLDIAPLGELLDMYQSRNASKSHDRAYALLGMASHELRSQLVPDYEAPWSQVMQKIVSCCFPGRDSVMAWDDKHLAIIRCRLRVLGRVTPLDQQSHANLSHRIEESVEPFTIIRTTLWKPVPLFVVWSAARKIHNDDVACVLEGMSKPTIIRLHRDYAEIVATSMPTKVIHNDQPALRALSEDTLPGLIEKSPTFQLPLVWDWDQTVLLEDIGESEFQSVICDQTVLVSEPPSSLLEKAIRQWTVGVLHYVSNKFTITMAWGDREVEERARRICSGALQTIKITETISRLQVYGPLDPLRLAVEREDESFVRLLLACENLGQHSEPTDQPLGLQLAKSGNLHIFKLLHAAGKIDANGADKTGRTLLSHAAEHGNALMVDWLLGVGKVQADQPDHLDRTPLWFAASSGQVETAKLLLDLGKANPNAISSGYWTPLWTAVVNGHEKVVELLLGTRRAVLNPGWDSDKTLEELAQGRGYNDIAKIVKKWRLKAGYLGNGCVESDEL
ncbi:heterokaryon incompatibility protein-domain-containing protein [Cercophora newfieldiana]|uniref:Heterokaryon incompatibility protein-domain-containing protein n=1 Tax=Cercophora newfieldiana TaxID=92897 RepID=A0AA39XW28_9PEZI|nr:heterokaryon incompatibility protein-domain-containing protein [Cercophora newfieldiana]